MDDLLMTLRDAGYETCEVPRPTVMTGCVMCGRDVEAIEGVCIRCAFYTEVRHEKAKADDPGVER